jgi:hypothetical protein
MAGEDASGLVGYVLLGIGLPLVLTLVAISVYQRLRLRSVLWFVAAQVLTLLQGAVASFLAQWTGAQVKAAFRSGLSADALRKLDPPIGWQAQWIKSGFALLICVVMLIFVIRLVGDLRRLRTPAAIESKAGPAVP